MLIPLLDLSRFLSFFSEESDGTSEHNYEQASLIYRITAELERYFGSGDELLGASTESVVFAVF